MTQIAYRSAVGIAWALVGGWGLAPIASRIGPRWQMLAWIPDWAWTILVAVPVLVALAATFRLPRGRWIAVTVALAAVLPPAIGTRIRDVGWNPTRPDPAVRIVFLNAQSPAAATAETELEAIIGLDADLVIVANPGWIPSIWRRRSAARGDDGWSIQWREPVMIASPHGPGVLRTLAARDGVRAVRVDPPESLGIEPILVVDLPSDPGFDREQIADALLSQLAKRGVRGLDDFELVFGDFNMTPRTPALSRLRGDLIDLVSAEGDGWTATWPRRRPVLRIDQVFARAGRRARVRTFDPGDGGHRGFVVELAVSGSG